MLENLFQLASVADPFATGANSKLDNACCSDASGGGFEHVLSLFGNSGPMQTNVQGFTFTKPLSGTLTAAGTFSTQDCLDKYEPVTGDDLPHQTEQPADFDFAATAFFAIKTDQLALQPPVATGATKVLIEEPGVDFQPTVSLEFLQTAGRFSPSAANVSLSTLDSQSVGNFSLTAAEKPVTARALPIEGELDTGSRLPTSLSSFGEAVDHEKVDQIGVPGSDSVRLSIAYQLPGRILSQHASETKFESSAATSGVISIPVTLNGANSLANSSIPNNFAKEISGAVGFSINKVDNQSGQVNQLTNPPDNHFALTYAPIKTGIEANAARSSSIEADQFTASQPGVSATESRIGSDVTISNDLNDTSQQLVDSTRSASTTGIPRGASTGASHASAEIRPDTASANGAINLRLPGRASNSPVVPVATPTRNPAQSAAPTVNQGSRISNDQSDSADANTILLEDGSLPRQTISNVHVNSFLESGSNRSQETVYAKHNSATLAGVQTPPIESGFGHVPDQVPASQPELAANNAGTGSQVATPQHAARASVPEQIMAEIKNWDSSKFSDSTSKSFEMRVKLSPPSLGEVVLLLNHSDLEKSASIFVADESIRHLVESKIEHLQESLRQLGFDSVEVDLFRQGAQDNRFQQERQTASNQRPDIRSGNSPTPVDEDLAAQPNSLSHQRIDLVV